MKLFTRILALALAVIMMLGCLSACSTGSETPDAPSAGATQGAEDTKAPEAPAQKTYIIGIAEAQANDEVTTRRAYLEKFIAPTYNVKFIFSEVLKDEAALKAFIENCIDAGADAIIDFKSPSGQLADLCAENGLVYTSNGSYNTCPELQTGDYENYCGMVGANNIQVGALFADWLEQNASEDGSEGFLISTSIAAQGNVQHMEITRALLTALQKKYGLTYAKDIEELIVTSEVMNAENDKNILITLYPGSPNKETWLPGISTLIQTGNYGCFMSSGQTYNQSATVVYEVEEATGMNIKVASVGALGSTLTTAFNTPDPHGNPSVDLITVKSVSALTACLFALTYNNLNGYHEASLEPDGTAANFNFNFIGIPSPEQLVAMEGWDDRDAQNWIAGKAFVDSMLCTVNPDLTAADIQNIMESMSFETISEMMARD